MRRNFYETLRVSRDADPSTLRDAYQNVLAELVRKLRAARQQGDDTAVLEADRKVLGEAWRVLSDPTRRRVYDRFLEIGDSLDADDADRLWSLVADSTVAPSAAATLELCRTLTDLALPTAPPLGQRPRRAGAVTPATPPRAPRPATLAPPPSRPSPSPKGAQPGEPMPGPTPAGVQAEATQEPIPGPEPETDEGADAATSLATLVFNHGYSGELIRRVREARGMDLEEISEKTRISRRYLEAIEQDDYARLPATTFVRGYLKEVARMLGLDPESLVGGYLARLNRTRG